MVLVGVLGVANSMGAVAETALTIAPAIDRVDCKKDSEKDNPDCKKIVAPAAAR